MKLFRYCLVLCLVAFPLLADDVSQNSSSNVDLSGSSAGLLLPQGTTLQRPTAVNGMIRYNSDGSSSVEAFINSAWQTIISSATGLVNLASQVTGTLPVANGGTASTFFQPVSLGQRPPTGTDDTTLGYGAGNFWNANGRQYVAQSVGAGTANWYTLPPINAPACDVVTGAAGCYGVYRMRAAYSGNAFNITRSSDSATLAIPFDVNGIASWTVVDNFCAGTSCGVNTWYDQSVNGYDLTQSTFANMPQIFNGYVGKLRAISFNGLIADTFMANASLPITNRNSFTLMAMVDFASSANTNLQQSLFQLGSPTATYLIYQESLATATERGLIRISPGEGATTGTSPFISTPQALLLVNASGTTTISQNNQTITPTVTGFSSASSTGIRFGDTNASAGWASVMSTVGFVVYNSALSSANQQLLLQAAYRDSGIQPQAKVNLVFVGSSLICCGGNTTTAPINQNFIAQLAQAFNDPIRMVSVGEGGASLATLNASTSEIATNSYVPGMTNIFVLDGASNDLASNQSASTVYSTVQAACAIVEPIGYKCMPLATFPRNSGFSGGQTGAGFETARQSLMSLESAGWPSFAQGFVHGGQDPTVGTTAALTNTSLYASDLTHLELPIGSSYETAIHVRALQSFIK